MGLYINTNIMAIDARRNLAMTNVKMSQALERLSSGKRINRAADDAAGLAISEKLTAQVRGLTQATRNAQDGISLVQTGEGALNETHDILQRMRELVVQAGTATVTDQDRTQIQAEVSQLQGELDRISSTTQYNGTQLLTGGFGTTASTTAVLADGISKVQSNGAKAGSYYLEVGTGSSGSGLKFTVHYASSGTATASDAAVATLDNVTAPAGLNTTTLNFGSIGLQVTINANASAANTNGKTVSVAAGTNNQFLVGANGVSGEYIGVNIGDMSSSGLGVTSAAVDVTNTSLTTQNMLDAIDTAIGTVSTTRANLGAVQNRLQHTINSLSVATENLSASNSRIQDADVAEETSNMVTAQILMQAGTSVLAQANQAPQSALSLLRG